jgi:LuxR family maltose regulon positive regulatory protein
VKQVIPPVPAGAITRERLAEQLRTSRTRLTVVVAPAGWGKTTLLSGWATDPDEKRRVAWVSLDENDDEPARFWTYVLTALRDVSDDIGTESLDALRSADLPAVDLALPVLLNELAASTSRHVLVLDDYHVLADPQIHEAVEFLITYLPVSLRVVIAARVDPPLPVARLRARGDLTELRAEQLRFRPDEAAALLSTVSGAAVERSAATTLWRRTEGWAAGLQLAGLALRADPGRPRADHRHLFDYFASEVLPGLAPRQRDLLVRCAPLELLSGPLCDAALDVTGSAAVLDQLVRADLFVAALDDDQQWYRCHRLLRDALRQLPDADPHVVLERAAEWFAAHDRIDDAVSHLLAADRDAAAAELLHRHASWFFERGAAAGFLQLGRRLSRSVVDAALAWWLAYAAAMCGDRDAVNRWLDHAEQTGTAATTVPGWRSLRAAVLSLRSNFGMTDAEAARTIDLARAALELETADGAPGHPNVRPALGAALARDGRFDEAATLLLDLWRGRRAESWLPWLELMVAGTLVMSLVEAGRGDECDRVLRDVAPLAASVEREGRQASVPGLAAVRLAEGRRRYQRGRADEALAVLRPALAIAELHPRPSLLSRGLVYLADAELACGDRQAARAALARAREVVENEPVSRFAVDLLEEAETRIGRGTARAAARAGALAEELTDRELSILRALQGTASQREIGSALFLSINTVKAYNKSLYRKLGVACRQDAVAAARSLGLI